MVSVRIFGLSLVEMEIAQKLHPAALAAVRKHAKLGFDEAGVEVHIPCDLVPVKKRGSIFVEVYIGELLDCEEVSLDPLAQSVSDAIAPSFSDGRIQVVVSTHQGMHGMYESPKLTAHKTTLYVEHVSAVGQVNDAFETGADVVYMPSALVNAPGYHVFVRPKHAGYVGGLKVNDHFRVAKPPAYDTVYCNGDQPIIFVSSFVDRSAVLAEIESIGGFEYQER